MGRVLLLILLSLMLGCVTEPNIKIHSARLAGVDDGGVTLKVTLAIRNDNSFDIQLRDVHADFLMANGYRVPTVHTSPNLWLPAGRTTALEVPVIVPWQIVMPLIRETIGSPTIPYHATGYANVTATRAFEIDIDEYALDQEGSISRNELVIAAARGLGG